MKERNIYIVWFLLVIFVLAFGYYVYQKEESPNIPDEENNTVYNFETCVDAGNPVMESYPAQCRDAKGHTYVQEIGNELDLLDEIVLDQPRPGTTIQSPLFVEGRARGYWFFEADFPVILTDWDGLIIAQGHATAKEDWMTEDFVPFSAVLDFIVPDYGDRGALILQKANPSGLPENSETLEIPIKFKK